MCWTNKPNSWRPHRLQDLKDLLLISWWRAPQHSFRGVSKFTFTAFIIVLSGWIGWCLVQSSYHHRMTGVSYGGVHQWQTLLLVRGKTEVHSSWRVSSMRSFFSDQIFNELKWRNINWTDKILDHNICQVLIFSFSVKSFDSFSYSAL